MIKALLKAIGNHKTADAAKKAMQQVCSKLIFLLRPPCKLLVNKYGDKIAPLIAKGLSDPNKVIGYSLYSHLLGIIQGLLCLDLRQPEALQSKDWVTRGHELPCGQGGGRRGCILTWPNFNDLFSGQCHVHQLTRSVIEHYCTFAYSSKRAQLNHFKL